MPFLFPSIREPVSSSANGQSCCLSMRNWTQKKWPGGAELSPSNKRIHNTGLQCYSGTFRRRLKSLASKESLLLTLAYCKPVVFKKHVCEFTQVIKLLFTNTLVWFLSTVCTNVRVTFPFTVLQLNLLLSSTQHQDSLYCCTIFNCVKTYCI